VDHGAAEQVFRSFVAGIEVPPGELDAAFEHAAACEACRARFELARAASSTGGEDMHDVPVEPAALLARASTAMLSAPEAVARLRAARRLATLPVVSAPGLAALVRVAAEDRDEDVRAAALAALDALDDEVSLSERVIAAWSEAPAEAEPYLVDVLRRLETLAAPRVARLETEEAGDELRVRGPGGEGRIVREEERLWLRLNRLPESFEKSLPVVAVPAAFGERAQAVEWPGTPGLVPSRDSVSGGSVDVYLGNLLPSEPLSTKLFERLYLLDPRKRRV